ncbi:MAG TPA: TolC family protein [Polyangiaceae bacterium]|nr:TolC family protein [Polyangiaceae bacterium]
MAALPRANAGGATFATGPPVLATPLLILSLTLDAVTPRSSSAVAPAAPFDGTPPAPTTAGQPGGVLRLADAIEIGLRNQPTVKQAHAQTLAAQARADQAGAPLLPQVALAASYQRRYGSAFLPGTAGTAGGVPTNVVSTTDKSGIDVFTVGGSATQLIWDFNQTSGRARAADRLAMSIEEQERVAAYVTAANIRRNFFYAREQKALIKVASDTRANVESHREQTRGFVRVGLQPDIALARAETDLANAEVALVNAENSYAVARTSLASSIGEPAVATLEIADDEIDNVDGEDLPADTLVARAMTARPEVRALDRQGESLQLTIRALRGGYGPALTAAAGASESGTALDRLGPAWNVGVTLSWPVFQGGLTRAQVREAEANALVTLAQLEAQKLQIRVDVQQAALSLRAAKLTQSATERAVVSARDQLRLAQGRFAQGVGNSIELGDAQVAMTNAATQLVQARFNLSTARANILAALGQP